MKKPVSAEQAHIRRERKQAEAPKPIIRPEAAPRSHLRLILPHPARPVDKRPSKRSRSPPTDPRLGRPEFVPEESPQKVPKFAEKRRNSIEELLKESSLHLQDPLLPSKEKRALDAAVASILPDLSIEDFEVSAINEFPVPPVPGRR